MTSLLTFGMTHFSNFPSTPSSLLLIWYRCESWTIKKAEHQRIDAFKLWCWWRLLRVPWTARRSNQSILKEINLENSLEGLMAEAEVPILCPPDEKSWLIGKDPDSGRLKTGGDDRGQMVGWYHWLNGYEFEQTFRRWWRRGKPGVLQQMG